MIRDGDCEGRLCTLPALLLLVFFVTLLGCDENSPEFSGSQVEPSSINVNDFHVPVFLTVEEQLNYTRSWFARIQGKRAALQAFIKIYPQEKRYCGLAALDLAYLQLGSDYRFADEYASFAAIKDYKTILEDYSEFPAIMAKAHWYIGWIYSDLLKDREKGVKEYQKIVTKYPRQDVTLLPPAPWVSIIYQTNADVNIALSKRPGNSWAALALVEIVRYAENEEIAWAAFQQLWQDYRDNVVVGVGLGVVLQKRYHTAQSLEMAREYMETEFSNVHILGDIQKEINRISGVQGGNIR